MPECDESREHRRRAQDCVEIAAKIFDPAHRLFVLHMAKAWLNLAERTDKNRKADVTWVNQSSAYAARDNRS